jgi:hypothetical protein
LSIAGVIFALRGRRDRFITGLPIAFAAAVLAVGMASRINIGVRHILPVYLGLSIAAGAAAWRLLETRSPRWAPALVLALAVWLAAGSLLSHPDYLPYFNELVWTEPERVLVDSDLDWGQDIKRLSLRLRQAGAPYVTFAPLYWTETKLELPPLQQTDAYTPYVGWNAVSCSRWKLLNLNVPRNSPTPPWPDRVRRQERVGKGILLWYFPPSSGLPAGP